MQEHPFQIARRAVRLMHAYRRDAEPGRPAWDRHEPFALAEVERRLAARLDAMGIASRKARGAVRRHLPAAYAAIVARRRPVLPVPSPAERVERRIVERMHALPWQAPAGSAPGHYRVADRRLDGSRLALVKGAWWYEYSRRHGPRRHEVAVLTGYEDGQWWARRVPYACATVADALAYVRPAAVNRALAEGREVRRQGDVWLVRLQGGRGNLAAIRGTDHRLDGGWLVHPQHGALDLGDGAWKAYLSKDTTRPMDAAARHD